MSPPMTRCAAHPRAHDHDGRMIRLLEGLISDGCVWVVPAPCVDATFDVWDQAALADLAERDAIGIDETDPDVMIISVGPCAEDVRRSLIGTPGTLRADTSAVQDDILAVLRDAGRRLTAPEVADRLEERGLGASLDWTKRNLTQLRKKGLIGNRRPRGDEPGGYFIVDAPKRSKAE